MNSPSFKRVAGVAAIVTALAINGGCATSDHSSSPVAAATTNTSTLSNGEILYGYRCKGCHEPATPGAPDRVKLARYEEREIIAALRRGKMKSLSAGLTKVEMQEIAAFLVRKT